MKLKLILLMVIAIAATSRAQERPDESQQAVTNDDGGKAFIVKMSQLNNVVKFGQPVDGEIEQHSIFLGSGWADTDLRAREPELSRLLLGIREHFQPDESEGLGIKNRFAPTFSQEKLDIPGNRNCSDLEIQRVLAGMFKDGTLQPPRAGAVYMLFLDPGLHSTLGGLVAEKHYEAYHAFFNASGARVHYVVLPFQPDLQAARQTALRALIVAAASPAGAPFQNRER
jgi:hypothetical protein